MKKLTSLILIVLFTISLGLLGCTKQEIEPVTVGELLDLIKAEGYTDIQHEAGTCEYRLVQSGDGYTEDDNDIVVTINNINENSENDYITVVAIDYNEYTDEVEQILYCIFNKVTENNPLVSDIVNKAKISNDNEFVENDCLSYVYWDYGEEFAQENDVYRFYVELFIE